MNGQLGIPVTKAKHLHFKRNIKILLRYIGE
jgi:hypothetical protein